MLKTASVSAMRHTAIAGLAMVVMAAVLQAIDVHPVRPFPSGLDSAALELQLMRDPAQLSRTVTFQSRGEPRPTDHTAALLRSVRIDYVFIASYLVFFALAGRALISSGGRRRTIVGWFVAVAALGGAALDVLENRAIATLLHGGMATLPRLFSLPKWTLVFVAVGGSALLLIDPNTTPLRRWVGYLACALSVFASLEAVYGIAADHDTLIEVASGRLAAALVLTEFFLWTPQVLADGVQAALDRAAARPWLRRIADWPGGDHSETVGTEPISVIK